MATTRICSVDGCNKRHKAHGYCAKHLYRLKADRPLAGELKGDSDQMDRLIETATVSKSEKCIIWPWYRAWSGYAMRRCAKGIFSAIVARDVCFRVHGAPPTPEHEAAHSCGNGHLGCINGNHLSWKTRLENAADRPLHGNRYGDLPKKERRATKLYFLSPDLSVPERIISLSDATRHLGVQGGQKEKSDSKP